MIKTCVICQVQFEIPKCYERRYQTCGKNSCHDKLIVGKGNPNWKGGEYKQCLICGKLFWVKPSHFDKRKTCSKKCVSLFFERSGKYDGENNPAWKGGLTEITRGIRRGTKYLKWKKEVLRRDEKCVICGSKRNLHVDHVKPFKEYPSLRFSVDNGRVLCWTCHKKTPSYGYNRKIYFSVS